jgi:tetratricopeptide (TPR) repeat protein
MYLSGFDPPPLKWSDLRRLSDVLWEQGDYPGVLQAGQHAIDLLKQLIQSESSYPALKRSLAESYSYAGSALQRLSRPGEARPNFDAALAIWSALADANPDDRALANEVEWTRKRIRELGSRP